jgi:hypothetical protein
MAGHQAMSMNSIMMIPLSLIFLTYSKVIGENSKRTIIKMRVSLLNSFLHSSNTLKIKISLILR